MAQVYIKNVSKRFGNHPVLSNLDFEIKDGEFVTLLGPSGCGKTTLLRMIAGLEKIDEGEIGIGGKCTNNIPAQNRHVAMVFQSYALFPHMSVYENIRFGLMINKTPKGKIKEKIAWALTLLELTGLDHRLPKEISGGQRQRVALARALVLDPVALLLDEPLSNLDTALREMAMEELKRIHRQVGKTVIYVSHNQTEAMTLSDRIALISGGRLEQYDTPRILYDYPKTIFAAGFIGSPMMNFYDGQILRQEDSVGVSTPIGFLNVDKEIVSRGELTEGRIVKVGIRPHNIYCAQQNISRRASDSTVTVNVELVQAMGDRSLVVAKSGNGAAVRFLITRDDDIRPDQNIPVFVDGRRIHLFDPQACTNVVSEGAGCPRL
jgi:multiple sugar transport system ATP-binding protein